MENGITCQFLGGSDEVGKLSMVMETNGMRFLFEYGMNPGKPPTFPLPAPLVDLVLLTHAHLDHSGMIPLLCSQADQTILSTQLTGEVSNLLQKDSVKIAKFEGYGPPFSAADVKEAEHSLLPIEPGQTKQMEHINLHTHSAGHIPGALMYEIQSTKRLLFTGDLHVIDTRLVKKAKPVPCDVLFLETTYAGREHPKRDELEKEFLDKIDDVVRRNGIVIIPAFAVARSQEIMLVLRKTGYNIWFDGMGKKVTKMFLKHPQHLNSAEQLKKAFNKVHLVHSDQGRKKAIQSDVIITSSGMMDGGPVLNYMNKLKNDKKSAVFLTGYQVEGTNSRLLIEEGKLNFFGVIEDIACEVQYFDFSAHAGHSELIEFAKACNPQKIVLFHGDNRDALKEPLQDVAEVLTPHNAEPFTV